MRLNRSALCSLISRQVKSLSSINDKKDDFLQKNDFSRDEIKSGLKELISRYGLTGMISAKSGGFVGQLQNKS